jgi:hypothetical protein
VDDQQQQQAAVATAEAETQVQGRAEARAQTPAETPKDALAAFIASGGTFGLALRDGLAEAQLVASGAARMSGEHLAGLLYSVGAAEQHAAPYTGRDYPNPRDYADDERR